MFGWLFGKEDKLIIRNQNYSSNQVIPRDKPIPSIVNKDKGLTYNSKSKRWIAQIYIPGKNSFSKHIGSYATKEEAYEGRIKFIDSLK